MLQRLRAAALAFAKADGWSDGALTKTPYSALKEHPAPCPHSTRRTRARYEMAVLIVLRGQRAGGIHARRAVGMRMLCHAVHRSLLETGQARETKTKTKS